MDATPGIKSTEFWVSLFVTVAGTVLAYLPDESLAAKIIGGAMAVLSQLGYTASRAAVKRAEASPSAGTSAYGNNWKRTT